MGGPETILRRHQRLAKGLCELTPRLVIPAAIAPQVQKSAAIKGLPQLPARVVKVQATAADSSKPVLAAAEEKKFLGVSTFTWQKIIPLGLMFFW